MRLTAMRAAISAGLLAAVVLTGCAEHPATPSPASASVTISAASGVRGQVMIDGGCPVVRLDSPCPDKPYSAKITVTRRGSDVAVATTVSDAAGRFAVSLPPGDYTLRPASLTGGLLPQAAPVDITVPADGYAEVTVHFDSGIR